MFYKGYTQTKEQKRKMKESRQKKYGEAICIACKETFYKYSKEQETCAKRSCMSGGARIKRSKDPIIKKAFNLGGSVRLGKGKKEKLVKLLTEALGTRCKYCEETINIENASLDHKMPRLGSKVHNRKTNKMIYTYEEIRELDKLENLHIVCRKCNQRKSNMNDEQYVRLLGFLNQNVDIKELIFHRFKIGTLFFRHKK